MKLSEFVTEFKITPHKNAPIFSQPDAHEILQQVFREVASSNFSSSNEVFRNTFRQAGLVNLWFYEKFILGYAGPYADLNSTLHLDMCNFRQSLLEPGSAGAIFVPRSAYKSTIGTHGANTWEITRNPDIRIGTFAGIQDRAQAFFKQVKTNFEDNELLAWLYPECVPSGDRGERWTESEIVCPARTKSLPEPSLGAWTAGGATAGIHVDLINCDDIVSDTQLNANYDANAEMYKIRNWFDGAQRTLLISMQRGRKIVVGTRYSLEDPYESIMKESKEHHGHWDEVDEFYPVDPFGEWKTYFRTAIEDNYSIFPDQYSLENLKKLAATKPQMYMLNYQNNPHCSTTVEFAKYPIYGFTLQYDDKDGWYFVLQDGEEILMKDCDTVMTIDPAGKDKFVSVRSSRTALLVLSRDSKDRKFIVYVKADFVPATTWFDWMFETWNKFKNMIRCTRIEQVAGFKSLTSIIQREQADRKTWINYDEINALGDKTVTIRNYLQPELERGLLYVNETHRYDVEEELRTFPGSQKRDILDTLKIGLSVSLKPDSMNSHTDEDDEDDIYSQHISRRGMNATTGY